MNELYSRRYNMKFFNFFSVICLTFGISLNAHAEKFRIQDRGMDGNMRGYNITCENGNKGFVTVEFELPKIPENVTEAEIQARMVRSTGDTTVKQVCIYDQSAKMKCQPQWDIKQAAHASCQ